MPDQSEKILISVIICTYNGCERIQETLESICFQSLPPQKYEIIVVDNNSDDNTKTWLDEHQKKYRYHLVHESQIGLSAARNRGVREAEGEYLFFIDDDAVAPVHLLSTYRCDIEKYNKPDMLGGAVHGLWEKTPPEWLNSGYWRSLSLVSWGNEKRMLQYPEILIGCNMMLHKSIFERYGFFKTNLGRRGDALYGNEERELEKRIFESGGKIYYNPDAYVFHKVPTSRMTIDYFGRRSHDAGFSQFEFDGIGKPLTDNILYTIFSNLYFHLKAIYKGLRTAYNSYRVEIAIRQSSRKGIRLFTFFNNERS